MRWVTPFEGQEAACLQKKLIWRKEIGHIWYVSNGDALCLLHEYARWYR